MSTSVCNSVLYLQGHHTQWRVAPKRSMGALAHFVSFMLWLLLTAHAVRAVQPDMRWQPKAGVQDSRTVSGSHDGYQIASRMASGKPRLSDPSAGPEACTAIPSMSALSELVRSARAADPTVLLADLASYLWQALARPLRHGCAYVSLTGSLEKVEVPDNFRAPDRHDLRKQGRMAILLMASDSSALLRQVDRFAMHFMTHWLYAKRFDYDVLIYVHRKAVPETSAESFYFFLKAPATQGALFTLGYSYVRFSHSLCCCTACPSMKRLHACAGYMTGTQLRV